MTNSLTPAGQVVYDILDADGWEWAGPEEAKKDCNKIAAAVIVAWLEAEDVRLGTQPGGMGMAVWDFIERSTKELKEQRS